VAFVEISKEEMEAIRIAYDLIDVVASYGIKVTKKGANYAALCPFHKEEYVVASYLIRFRIHP
jgi:DNA primase